MSTNLKLNPVKQIRLLVRSGQVNSGPPLGPVVGPLGLNAKKIADQINRMTAEFKDLKVLVKLSVNRITKLFELSVQRVSTATLFLKYRQLNKGCSDRTTKIFISNEELDEFMAFAETKTGIARSRTSVIGTLGSLGVTVR